MRATILKMLTMGITAAYRPDHPCVSLGVLPVDGADTGPIVDVPELQGTVQGPADDACRVKLQTGDGVLMSHQRPQTRSLVVPHLSEEIETMYQTDRQRKQQRERVRESNRESQRETLIRLNRETERKHMLFKNTIYKILGCGIYHIVAEESLKELKLC